MAAQACRGAVSSGLPVHRPAHSNPVSTLCSNVSNRSRSSRLQRWRIRAGSPDPSSNQRSSSSTSTNGTTPSIIKESDFSFLGKLVVASFAGAALIKYGSLLISLPFEPDAIVALAVVLGTPALYSLYLLTQKQQ